MNIRLVIAVVLTALLMNAPLQASADPLVLPVRVDDGFTFPGPPEVSAVSWLLYDETADLVLASFAPHQERAIASTTKIMTGLLVLENASLDEVVTVSRRATSVGEKEIELYAGEQISMDALFKALMIHSANDAAIAIAEHISGSVEEFVRLMNERAVELGLEGTHFANPHGLDHPDHYSTAADLLTLARVAMSHPQFASAVQARLLVFPPAPDGAARVGAATNLLLGDYEGAIGVKTGFTNEASLTFVASAERNQRRVYVVVLGSEGPRAHFADARALLDYAFFDLGFIGSLISGTEYTAMRPGFGASPLRVSAAHQALIHLAAQGLMTGELRASDGHDLEPSIPRGSDVVRRRPTEGPTSPVDALMYWFEKLMPG